MGRGGIPKMKKLKNHPGAEAPLIRTGVKRL